MQTLSMMTFLRRRAKEVGSSIFLFSEISDHVPIPTGDGSLGVCKDSWKEALKDLWKEGKIVVTGPQLQPPRDLMSWVIHVK